MSAVTTHNPNSAVYATANSGVEVRDGATVLTGGNIDGTNVTKAPTHKKIAGYGSIVTRPGSTPSRTKAPFAGGPFAYVMEAGRFLIRRAQTHLAGQSVSGILLNRGSEHDGHRVLHQASGYRRLSVISYSSLGVATTGSDTGKRAEFGADREIGGWNAIPAQFSYLEPKLNIPTQKDYPKKTG